MPNGKNAKSLEFWIWDAACTIHGAKDTPNYMDYILYYILDNPEQVTINNSQAQ